MNTKKKDNGQRGEFLRIFTKAPEMDMTYVCPHHGPKKSEIKKCAFCDAQGKIRVKV